jgi:hypothetical protein
MMLIRGLLAGAKFASVSTVSVGTVNPENPYSGGAENRKSRRRRQAVFGDRDCDSDLAVVPRINYCSALRGARPVSAKVEDRARWV